MASDPSSAHDRLDELETRLDRLEAAVEELRSAVRKGESSISGTPDRKARDRESRHSGTEQGAIHPDRENSVGKALKDSFWTRSWAGLRERLSPLLKFRSRDWLSYVGIALLLFGLAFLFKYSVEQGWLVPEVRVGFGVFVGCALLVGGLRIYDKRRRLRQVLLGGSVATFYGTTFAAYQLYSLLPYPIAFGSMVTVTIVAIVTALRQDHASMGVIGTIGGLGTPFLLYTDFTGVAGLSVYAVLVLVGACAIYFYRGWQVVLYSAVFGGWLVLLFPCADAALSGALPDGVWVLQGSIVSAWLLLGSSVVFRSVLGRLPSRTGEWTAYTNLDDSGSEDALYSLVPLSPFAALTSSRLLWSEVDGMWAAVAVLGALIYSGAYAGLRHLGLRKYAAIHGIVAATLIAYCLASWFGGAVLLLSWGLEAALLLILGRRIQDAPLRIAGHVLFAVVGGWLAIRLTSVSPEASLLSAHSLLEVVVLGIAVEATRRVGHWPRRLYGILALAGWLAWIRHIFVPLENGHAFVSALWAVTATVLLALGTIRRSVTVQSVGMAVLALFVCKLFLVDLTTLPALWRILLFVGAGGSFLLMSYALPDVGPVLSRQ